MGVSKRVLTVEDMGGKIHHVRRFVDPENKLRSATNASIGFHPDSGFVCAIRSSNYVILPNGSYFVVEEDSDFQSDVWFAELDDNFKCLNLRKIDLSAAPFSVVRGLEDPKLFWRDGAWNFTCVIKEKGHTEVARMGVARIDAACTSIVSLVKFDGFDESETEKNWAVTHAVNPEFDFIYGANSVIKDGVVVEWLSDAKQVRGLRGNTNLWDLGDGSYLAVCHRTIHGNKSIWVPSKFGFENVVLRDYYHYFVRYNSKGFIDSISEPFYFIESGVEFAAGLVIKDNRVYVSFGRKDVSSHVAELPFNIVMDSLKKIDYKV